MTAPIEVDIPHKLGTAQAKERIGGSFVTEHRWQGDTLHFTVEGLGQRVAVHLDVRETNVHAMFELPAFLAMFSDKIRDKLQREAPKLLE
jgi:hypothetical protein